MSEAVSIASIRYIEKRLIAYQLPVGDKTAESLRLLPKETRREIRKEAKRIAEADVFGADHKRDKDGNPIEQGLGSVDNCTLQHVEAYIKNQTERRNGGPEPGYEDNLARMRKQLAACEARRAAERQAREDAED